MVGDRLEADLAGARAAGLDGAVVLTGATSAAMARAADPPPPSSPTAWPSCCSSREEAHPSQALLQKGYRRLLDRLAAHEAVHRVATGRVTPRMGAGRPVAPISKVRRVPSGLSITINTEGAMVDAYVITDRPEEVADFIRESGWSR